MEKLRRLELVLAVGVTALAIYLHAHATWHFGGLWRDEVNSVGIDSLPSFGSVWNDLQYDSFPILWHSTLRAWLLLGFTSDASLRLFGFLIGVAVLGALWLHARAFGRTSPLIALVLLEFNPTILRWGDTIRGHGLGLFFSIGIPGAIWLVLQRPGARSFFVALGLCLLAVQSQFYNAVLLLAAAAGGTGVALWHRNYRAIGWIGAVGILCALSLLPYLPAIHQAGAWNILVKVPDFPLSLFVGKLLEAAGSPWEVVLWLVTFVAGGGGHGHRLLPEAARCEAGPAGFFPRWPGGLFHRLYRLFSRFSVTGPIHGTISPSSVFSALALDGMIGSTPQKLGLFSVVRRRDSTGHHVGSALHRPGGAAHQCRLDRGQGAGLGSAGATLSSSSAGSRASPFGAITTGRPHGPRCRRSPPRPFIATTP